MTNEFMIKNLRFSLFATFSLSAVLFLSGCDKDMAISLKNDNIDNLNVSSVDSLSAVVSTVQMPTIPTAATGTLLVGKVTQPIIGSLTSNTFFRLNPAGITNDFPTTAKFDSLNLVIRPSNNRYAYGDTSKIQKMYVHRLTQALETTTLTPSPTGISFPIYYPGATIFAHQSFNFDANALGSVSFRPHMSKVDTLSVRLSDAVGTEFFQKIKNNDVAFNSASNFQEYFKGLTIRPDAGNTAMVGFKDTLEVRINYSYVGTDGFRKKGVKTLNMADKSVQYNNIVADRTGTEFEALTTTNPLPVAETNGISFIQAGSGVATQISFPALRDFMQQPGIAINKAELEIEIASSHLGYYTAAPQPVLYTTDMGVPTNFLPVPFTNTVQTGTYILGNNTGRPGKYVFNMIQYIRTVNLPDAQNKSLYLSLGNPALFSTGNTSILATQNNQPKVKLNIVYTKFK